MDNSAILKSFLKSLQGRSPVAEMDYTDITRLNVVIPGMDDTMMRLPEDYQDIFLSNMQSALLRWVEQDDRKERLESYLNNQMSPTMISNINYEFAFSETMAANRMEPTLIEICGEALGFDHYEVVGFTYHR